MKLILTEIDKKLKKAYLKQDLHREQIECFKSNLKILFSKADIAEKKKEHEEHFKNLVSDFLKDTYYKNNYEININKRKDLVIHNGNSSSDSIGVIIEAKKPSNINEMVSQKNPNAKALHELLHYYMEERFINNNKEIKHLIATNSYDWFIIDARDFEEYFYNNKNIVEQYKNWSAGLFGVDRTNWFYDEFAKDFFDKALIELSVVYFNLLTYKEIVDNSKDDDDENLINLYKILSPEHLLKKPFANDSNTLNKEFYNELLHIIGLEEKPDGGKKLIDRKQKNRDDGSLIENAINILKTRNKLKSVENLEQFGETEEEQLYSIGLELCITWLNRILFLKLLEGQLIKYHNGNNSYSFINAKNVKDFDELDELFFEVLAVKTSERSKSVNDKFGNIPYLNSSLFEISNLESITIQISDLKDRLELAIYSHSVLRNKEEFKTIESKNTLHYLFEFLSAYNFASDTSAKIQEDNKTIINASVLGLIFEKINGYKDGSFFTPGFITMYMSRETIRRAIAQKFKELENKEIETFDDVTSYCARYFKKDDILRFNNHINSLKICDPAVGSGHFLVSALNEIIAIKSVLNILTDSDGTPLEYEITVDNDELTIINKKTNKPFEYKLGQDNKPPKSLQQAQVTLFQEKQQIIENCLFGVDINPKSVLICRLRLWIELLKNSYYKSDDYLELETLPNIDINIKCGNSLISRFNLSDNHSSLPPSTQQKLKLATEKYKEQVIIYKSTNDKKTKQNSEKEIARLKEQFAQIANPNDADYKKLQEKKSQLGSMPLLFSKEEQDAWKQKTEELTKEVTELEKAYNNKLKTLYGNTLEWRFEFPEVLDENGDFVGFDVVIGNPPYVFTRGNEFDNVKHIIWSNYLYNKGKINLYSVFLELSTYKILKNNGFLSFITPETFIRTSTYREIRNQFITDFSFYEFVIYGIGVFENVTAETITYIVQKAKPIEKQLVHFKRQSVDKEESLSFILQSTYKNIPENRIIYDYNQNDEILFEKIKKDTIPLGQIVDVRNGIATKSGKNQFISKTKLNDKYKKLLEAPEIYRYGYKWKGNFICYDKEALHRPRKEETFLAKKILIQRVNSRLVCCIDNEQFYTFNSINNLVQINNDYELEYILAILNSKLINYYYKKLFSLDAGFTITVTKENLDVLPIKIIDKTSQKGLVDLVVTAINISDKSNVNEDIINQIDKKIYELYEITDSEIENIEKSV